MIFPFSVLMMAILLQASTPETPKEQQIEALRIRAESGDAKAEVQLGFAYATGDGIKADETEAVKWFRKAAEKGDAAGEYSLGEMYLTGRGVAADVAEGVKWVRLSAEHGDPRGQTNLGAMYLLGQGIPKDENEAAKWMRKAADQGFAAGQFGLGSMYAHGRGVPQDEEQAVKWYGKAADQGDIPAANNLAFLLATSQYAKVRNTGLAVAIARKVIESQPDNPTYLDTLATAYFEDGQLDKAAETEQRALTLSPDNASYKQAFEKYRASAKR